jgi:hypothetical protein
MRFAAPWDRALRVSTPFALLVLLAGTGALAFLTGRAGGGATPVAMAAGVLVLAGVGLVGALAPRGFAVEAGVIRVERGIRPVEIPLASVRAIAPAPPGALRGALRLGGAGGIFGYYGRYWTRGLGSFRLYATRREALVLVDTDRERFVLSPEPAVAFVEEVLARAPHATADAGAPVAPRPLGRSAKAGIAAVVLAVPAAVGAVLVATWAYAPVGARVTDGAVVVDRRWAGPDAIPLAEVRGAMLLPPEALRGARRISGVALAGMRYGRFRSDYLGPFQLYAWHAGPAVLLATRKERIVLTPEDPERFVEDVNGAVAARAR